MKKFTGLTLTCALLVLIGLACERAAAPPVDTSAVSSALTTIPAEYGELEAVTSVPDYPGWFQLWFEDEEGTIRMVRVQIFDDLIHNEVKTIERSGMIREEVTEDEG